MSSSGKSVLMACLFMSTCVYPVVQSSEGHGVVTRTLSRQRSDVTDHPNFCDPGWGEEEEYRGQQTYSSCVPQVNSGCTHNICEWVYLFYMVGYLHVCYLFQHPMLYRTDSADYRAQGADIDSGVEAGSDMTPPTPAFPISPPTPYGEYCILTCAVDFESICDNTLLVVTGCLYWVYLNGFSLFSLYFQ